MNKTFLFAAIGFFVGSRGVPMLVHMIYTGLVMAAYFYGKTHA